MMMVAIAAFFCCLTGFISARYYRVVFAFSAIFVIGAYLLLDGAGRNALAVTVTVAVLAFMLGVILRRTFTVVCRLLIQLCAKLDNLEPPE